MYHKIYDEYYMMVFRYCYALLDYNMQDALQCTQTVFEILFKKINSLKLSCDIKFWLYNTSDKIIKKQKCISTKIINTHKINLKQNNLAI